MQKGTKVDHDRRTQLQNKEGIDMNIINRKSSSKRSITMRSGSNLDLALNLVTCGFSVFPCEPDKKPLIVGTDKDGKPVHLPWKTHLSNDQQKIATWWTLHPQAPIGIPCELNGFFALDLDRHGGADGVANFQALAKGKEKLATGPVQDTAGGGKHYLFSTGGLDIPQVEGKIAPGVDIKSDGYICTGTLPDGRAYNWLPRHGFNSHLPTAPAWLLERIKIAVIVPDAVVPEKTWQVDLDTGQVVTQNKPRRHKKAIKTWMRQYLAQAVPGESRNTSGFNLANQLRDDGYTRSEAEVCEYPEKVPQKEGVENYTRENWEASVKQAFKYQLREQAKKPTKATVKVADPGPRDRIDLWDARFALSPQPPMNYLVDGLFIRPSVNVFFGEPGAKKTYSALSLAVCVASGKPWLGFETKKSPVLIIDEESGKRRLARRLGDVLRGEKCGKDTEVFCVSLAGFKLDDENDIVLIHDLINKTSAKLVIFDPFADLFDGDENSKQFTQPVFHNLRRIAEETDCTHLVIHHSNKVGTYRGSTVIKAAIDLMVQITSDPDSNLVNFQATKNKDEKPPKWAAEAVFEEGKFCLKPSIWVPVKNHTKNPAQEFVLKYLGEHGASFVKDIKSAADNCTPEEVRRAVITLKDKGTIKRINIGAPTKLGAKYDLADDINLGA